MYYVIESLLNETLDSVGVGAESSSLSLSGISSCGFLTRRDHKGSYFTVALLLEGSWTFSFKLASRISELLRPELEAFNFCCFLGGLTTLRIAWGRSNIFPKLGFGVDLLSWSSST